MKIKRCTVVLERLDEKLLSQYLKKYDSNTTDMVGLVKNVINQSKRYEDHYSKDFTKRYKNSKGSSFRQKLEKNKKSSIKNKHKRKKRKVKLWFNDDKYPTDKSETSENEKSYERHDQVENHNTMESLTDSKIGGSLPEVDEITSKSLSSNSKEIHNTKNADNEVEIIHELRNPAVSPVKITSIKEEVADSASIKTEQNFENDDDFRDDNEDDKLTVIFENSPVKDMVSEADEREVEWPAKKIKNEKTELNTEENLDKKPEIRCIESTSAGKPSEIPETKESDIEYHLHNLCTLVKRLYESFMIITQLIKEFPKNDELAVHFSKVIKVQKEKFYKEITKSHKIITDCYEKLVVFYGSANRVVLGISKNAFLSVDDVNKILSQCFLLKSGDKVKSNAYFETHFGFLQPKVPDITEKFLKRLGRNKIRKSHPPQYSFPSSENFNCQYKLMQKPAVSCVVPAGKNAVMYTSDPNLRSYCNDYNFWKQNRPQVWTHPQNQNQVVDPHLRQQPPNDVSLRYPGLVAYHSDSVMLNNQVSNMKALQPHPHSVVPQQKRTESSAPIRYLSCNPVCYPNCILSKPPSQFNQNNYGSPVAQNVSVPIRQQNNMPREGFAFPTNIHNRMVEPQKHPFGDAQHPLGGYINNTVSYPYQIPSGLLMHGDAMLGKSCSLDMKSRTEFNNTSNKVANEILDPTIPQKLTMKNCRLQAEPVIRRETEGKLLKPEDRLSSFQPNQITKKQTEECRGLGEENSKSRMYVCAQNGCKMPGILICKGCQSVIYCSETCQLKHWALKHKTECYQLKVLRGV